ncbi:NERD domain-containing protein [Halobacteriovorax sp. DPLXC-1]|uniref:NERD domain-containing protein n=1 Tax=Halobacteriovorax sp. DPLXC-1 TaxID=3110771 RepID=UPI002FF188D3
MQSLRGELKTRFQLYLFLDRYQYPRFHDLIIPSSNGTTQLDHVVISKYGVFIVETKSHKGWIFGNENQKNWTQVLFKKKFSFQNPLRQVYRQKKILAEFLGIVESKIFSIIYFNGKSHLKTDLPNNVMTSCLDTYIRSHTDQLFNDEEVLDLVNRIESFKKNSNLKLADHLESLQSRHNSMVTCPRCGGKLLKKVARRGKNAGGEFLGCMNYPRCRFTRDL